MEKQEQQLIEKMVYVNRVTKVVKGGRIMGFVVLSVVGDGNGSVGIGKAKAKEVSIAAQKSLRHAKNNMITINLNDGTIHHNILSKHSATTVYIKPAPDGTGIIAGGTMRAIFEAVGIKNITAKIHGSSNPYNVVRATLNGLRKISPISDIAAKRGKTINEIIGVYYE